MAAPINAAARKRLLDDIKGDNAVVRTANDARKLKQALRDAIQKTKHATLPNWQKGATVGFKDRNWLIPILSKHGVSVPRSPDERSFVCAIKYDFMPYTIVKSGAADMTSTILRLQIPAPRDPFLPPPGLTSDQVIEEILRMTLETGQGEGS